MHSLYHSRGAFYPCNTMFGISFHVYYLPENLHVDVFLNMNDMLLHFTFIWKWQLDSEKKKKLNGDKKEEKVETKTVGKLGGGLGDRQPASWRYARFREKKKQEEKEMKL